MENNTIQNKNSYSEYVKLCDEITFQSTYIHDIYESDIDHMIDTLQKLKEIKEEILKQK